MTAALQALLAPAARQKPWAAGVQAASSRYSRMKRVPMRKRKSSLLWSSSPTTSVASSLPTTVTAPDQWQILDETMVHWQAWPKSSPNC